MKFLAALRRHRDTIDLQRHDEILREMKQVTEKLRRREPITSMVLGEWRHDDDQEGPHDERND